MKPSTLDRLRALLRNEIQELARVNATDRLWQLPLAATLAMGAPLLLGVWFARMDLGLVGSLGGLVFLYVTHTPLHHRMVALMACAFGMTACYGLGVLSHPYPALVLPVITVVAILVTMIGRFYALAPPGSLFFVMATAIGAHTPVPRAETFAVVGVFALATLFAVLVAFVYSLATLRVREAAPVRPLPEPTFDHVVFDAVLIGLFVGLSLLLAQWMGLSRPYWVPVSCLSVIQGVSLRAVWNRQLQRVLGTAVGLLLAGGILSLPLGPWGWVVLMMLLSFVIEHLVVRHYALATVFITPLTLLLAEAAQLGQAAPAALMQARLLDTVLGCAVGLVGGVCLHSPRFREALGQPLRRLLP